MRLAPRFRDNEHYGTAVYAANLVLAGLTLREGDSREAGRYLIEASRAPVNDAAAQIRKGYRPIWYPRDTRYYPGIMPG
jgi:hypothetical protein